MSDLIHPPSQIDGDFRDASRSYNLVSTYSYRSQGSFGPGKDHRDAELLCRSSVWGAGAHSAPPKTVGANAAKKKASKTSREDSEMNGKPPKVLGGKEVHYKKNDNENQVNAIQRLLHEHWLENVHVFLKCYTPRGGPGYTPLTWQVP